MLFASHKDLSMVSHYECILPRPWGVPDIARTEALLEGQWWSTAAKSMMMSTALEGSAAGDLGRSGNAGDGCTGASRWDSRGSNTCGREHHHIHVPQMIRQLLIRTKQGAFAMDYAD